MSRNPAADAVVQIVGDPEEADYRVQVIGDQVVDLSGASPGDVLIVGPDGTLEPADLLAAGTLAARPAASADNAGFWYFATDDDGGTIYRSNGVSWVQAAPGVTERQYVAFVDDASTAYQLVLDDDHRARRFTAATAIAVTIPTEATVAFPIGAMCPLIQSGAGQITVSAAGGVTLNGTPSLKSRAQHSALFAWKTGTDRWLLLGDKG